jgi:hypothetical protein
VTDEKCIALTIPVTADDVWDVVRSVAEARGYSWESVHGGARIAEGGHSAAGESSMSLVVDLTIDDDALTLSRRTTGYVSVALGLGPLGPSSVSTEFVKISDAVTSALRDAGLVRI